MAARDNSQGNGAGSGRSKAVHGLMLPEDNNSVPVIYGERFARGQQRAAVRKSKLASSLSVAPPKPEEVSYLCHPTLNCLNFHRRLLSVHTG